MNPLAEAWRLLTSGDLHLWEIVLRSLYISGTALGLATLVGLPIGAAIGLSRFRLRGPTVALVNTALALPPVVVGLTVYLLLSRSGPLGGLGMLYSPGAMILAQTAIAAPYVAAISLAAASEVPPDLQLQARALGASRLEAVLVTLREARASLLAAVAAGFGAIISEVGAVMIVGGNILGETRVMTTAIVLETRRGNFGLAIALGAILLTIALAINLLLVSIGRADLRRPWSS
jgi:tungstate transport system permease protein